MLEFRYIKKPFWQTFVLCLLVAVLIFLPSCIQDALNGSYFVYAGDYDAQTILFNEYMNAFIKEGGSFSWETDLGSGFVNAYSYYGLGSVFFWISCLLPSKLVPWALVPLMCLKFAVAGSGAYLWAKRYVKNTRYAMLAGVLYAFSGFMVYSIFFGCFMDAVALFPYMLASLDDALMDGKRGVFSFWMALNLLNNYYFFFAEGIFLVIYVVCQILGGHCRMTLRLFFRMLFETVLGILMGCALLVPAILSLAGNPRLSSYLNGYEFINYTYGQQYVAILENLFLMPDAPYGSTMFPNADVKWTNLTAYLPVVGITGGVALCRVKRKHPFSRILKFSILCAFVPALNQMFDALNEAYYARWFFMPVLILCGATALTLEDEEVNRVGWKDAWRVVFAFTLGFAALGLVPEVAPIFGLAIGVANPYYFWPMWGVSMGGVVACGVIHKKYYKKERFLAAMLSIVLVFSFLYGEVHLFLTKYEAQEEGEDDWANGLADSEDVQTFFTADGFYRTDATEENNYNLAMGTSSEIFFSSTVSPGIFSFYEGLGLTRSARSNISESVYALRSLLSTRYLTISLDEEESWCAEESSTDSEDEIVLTEENADEFLSELTGDTDSSESDVTYIPADWADNWTEIGRTDEFIVYENANFISMGFTYDYYITQEQYEESDLETRSNLLLKALVLTDEQIETYGDLLEPLPEDEFENCTYEAFVEDCAARNEGTAEGFTADYYGFTATTNYEEDELVFFSVPYEDNAFTATVNGETAKVEEVDEGLMAIRVPAGECTIRVDYHTPGLRAGIGIALAGVAGYVCYLIVLRRRKKRTPETAEPSAQEMSEEDGESDEENSASTETEEGCAEEETGEEDSAQKEKEEVKKKESKLCNWIQKIKQQELSNKKLFLIAVLITALMYVIVCLATEMAYQSNDDERIQAVLSGYWTGSPHPNWLWVNVIWSHFIAALYILFPKLQWWWVCSHVVMAVGITLAHYGIMKSAKKHGARFWTVVVFLLLLDVGFFFYSMESVAFTVTGMILGTGIIAVLFCLVDAKSVKVARIGMIAVFCGYLLAFMYRKETGYVLLCYLLLVCLYVIRCRCENLKQTVKKFALTAGVFIVATVALAGINQVVQTKENGEEWIAYDLAKFHYRDFPHDSYEENPELYESIGWDEEQWYLVENWCFLDESVNTENLTYLAENNHNSVERTLDLIKNLMSSRRSRAVILLWVLSAGAGVLVTFYARNKRDFWFTFLNNLGTCALLGYLLFKGRINYRSLVIELLPAFTINVIFLLRNCAEARRCEPMRIGRIVLAGLGVYAYAFAFVSTFSASKNATMAYLKQRTTAVYEYFESNPDNFYVTQFEVTDDINPWRLMKGSANNIQWGGALWGSGVANTLLENNGISELTGETFKEDRVYFVSLADALSEDEDASSDMDYVAFAFFYHWLKENYGAIGFVQEGEIAEGVYLYHFVFPENASDYDTWNGI